MTEISFGLLAMWAKSNVLLLIDIVNCGFVGVVLHNSEIKLHHGKWQQQRNSNILELSLFSSKQLVSNLACAR
jgi:hypothetical protein